MALTIEDGTIVADANSFITLIECRAFGDLRGLDIPADDTEAEQAIVKAADFLSSLETDFQGTRTDPVQTLPFPREDVCLYDVEIDNDSIPAILKNAQCRLAFDASLADLLKTGGGRVVKKEQVGPLSKEFADDGASNPQLNLTAALAILKPLFHSNSVLNGGSINIEVGR